MVTMQGQDSSTRSVQRQHERCVEDEQELVIRLAAMASSPFLLRTDVCRASPANEFR